MTLADPEKTPLYDPVQTGRIEKARFDHYNLCIQFGSGALLMLISEVVLLFDVVLGWKIHKDPTLLASSLLVPMLAYSIQATISTVLICIRAHQGKASSFVGHDEMKTARNTAQGSVGSDYHTSSAAERKARRMSPQNTAGEGYVQVHALEKEPHNRSQPTMIQQIQVVQFTQTDTDSASLYEAKTRSDGVHDSLSGYSRDDTVTPEPTVGTAL